MDRCHALAWIAFSVSAAAFIGPAAAQFPKPELPKSEPEEIVNKATIVMSQSHGSAETLQTGTNGFTCRVTPVGTPACADANGTEWFKAAGTKAPPPEKTGFIYMVAGHTGTSNHGSYATDKSQWV